MTRLATVFVLLIFHINAHSFDFVASDSLQHSVFFPKKYGDQKWRIMGVIDIKRSFNNPLSIGMYSLRGGVEHNGIERINLGITVLGSAVNSALIPSLYIQNKQSTFSDFQYKSTFGSLYYERAIFRTRLWEVAIPAYFLFGNIHSGYLDTSTNNKISLGKDPFMAIVGGLQVQYYLFHWLAPKVSVGYRHFFATTSAIQTDFSSAYFGVSARVYWNYLFTHFFNKKNRPTDHKGFWSH